MSAPLDAENAMRLMAYVKALPKLVVALRAFDRWLRSHQGAIEHDECGELKYVAQLTKEALEKLPTLPEQSVEH